MNYKLNQITNCSGDNTTPKGAPAPDVRLRLVKSSKYINIKLYFRSPKLAVEDFFLNLQTKLPNLPILHWWENKDKNVSEICWKVPNLIDLKYNNKYWQVKETSNGTFYLYAAYYDVRKFTCLGNDSFLGPLFKVDLSNSFIPNYIYNTCEPKQGLGFQQIQ